MPPTTKTTEDMNKRIIRITKIQDHGRCHEQWCDQVLMLRYARRVGDTEVINNTQLGTLRRFPSEIEFEVLTPNNK